MIKYLYETYGNQIYLSIMNQYTPLENVSAYPELNRKVTDEEYEEVVDYAIGLGVEQGFIQEGELSLIHISRFTSRSLSGQKNSRRERRKDEKSGK